MWSRLRSGPLWGMVAGLALVVATMVIPPATGWQVNSYGLAPLISTWGPRIGIGTVAALILAVVAVRWYAPRAQTMGWRRLMLTSGLLSLLWMVSLASLDGVSGFGRIFEDPHEYLQTARSVTDVPALLHTFVSRIPLGAPLGEWATHVAGHPPLALLFFVALVRIGLDNATAIGAVVIALAATIAPAVLQTVRTLGDEGAARRAAPYLVIGPAAIWLAVSADALFAAVSAWGLLALALATATAGPRRWAWATLSGLLLGSAVLLSYGLLLLGVLALAVLWVGRSWRPLPVVAGAALVPMLVLAAHGFSYWDALPVLRERYWAGIAAIRPTSYWIFGDLAALLFSTGPLLAAGVGALVTSPRRLLAGQRVAAALGGAALVTVLAADLSLMSKAEVERIWLPFVPWLLLTTALLPERWRRWGFTAQVVFTLLIAHLMVSSW
jgi:VanZ family protein